MYIPAVANGMNVIIVRILIIISVVRSDVLWRRIWDNNCPPSKVLTGRRLIKPRQKLHSVKLKVQDSLKIKYKITEIHAVRKLNIIPAEVI